MHVNQEVATSKIEEDPFKSVRRQIPPPDFTHKPKTVYDRQDNKKSLDKELDEWYNDDEDLKPFWEEDQQ